ncbi:hypothetical protein C8R45DRAFT_413667 [Mycena sanguinolenta]|nr:hypothetical protein C8R45DRAFT_413667 [Mycena sanguinolenta]
MKSIASRCVDCDATGRVSPCDFSAVPGTRHHGLLKSNQTPLDSDTDVVNSAILRADKHLAWLDEKIPRFRKPPTRLADEQAFLSSYRTENQAIFSPLRRMPSELLSEIFAWSLLLQPEEREREGRGRFFETDSPWVLTHVSRIWREISVSTPSLWSKLTIDYSTWDLNSSYPLAMIETHLARAQNLRIVFRGSQIFKHSNQTDILSHFVQFVTASQRGFWP